MIFAILSLALQAGLIVHVIRTGRNTLWIWAIALLPPVGPIAYVAAEIVPELFGGKAGRRRASLMVRRVIDPDRDLRRASAEVQISGNVEARRRLAEELAERGQHDAAIEAYAGALKGIFEHDPTLLFGLARAQFAKGDYAAARTAMQDLRRNNPQFRSPEADLLYARTLEALEEFEAADGEYAAVARAFPGAEARVRYALLHKRLGKTEEARRTLKELLDEAQWAPAHYRKAQAQWLERARLELR